MKWVCRMFWALARDSGELVVSFGTERVHGGSVVVESAQINSVVVSCEVL
jgi:hypothetical protein